jgi:molybdenum cofactor cytidylyltransferase
VAGLPVGRQEIAALGVGGLLAETSARGQQRDQRPTEATPRAPRIAGLVLAAGRSSRMGSNKLLIQIDGQSLIERSVEHVAVSGAAPIVVVVGHDAQVLRTQLHGRQVQFVENPHFAEGLSTSLRAGIAALPPDIDGALVALGDMPDISPRLIGRMIAAFDPNEGREIVVPVRQGKRGNPVLWGRRYFSELAGITGDTGAKHLIGQCDDRLVEIEAESDGLFIDLDTPEALAAYQAAQQ